MKTSPLKRGDVLIVAFPLHVPQGHEQEGHRPAIVAGLPSELGKPRYPMVVVAPVTSSLGAWASQSPKLYPTLSAGAGNLRQPSAVLLDHLRGIDLKRIVKRIGSLSESEYEPIRQALVSLFRSKR